MFSHHILQNKFKIFIFLSLFILAAEILGGIFTNSLALFSDAGHVFIDILALCLTYFSLWLSQKSANEKFTFGFYRAEILTALINGAILILITFFIFYEAISRLINRTVAIKGLEMLGISILGFAANFYVILRIKYQEKENLNIHSAYLHVLSDTLSSVGVILASILIIITGKIIFDPIISLIIALIIFFNAIRLLKESTYILMETMPKNFDIKQIAQEIQKINGVKEIHDIKIWSISSDIYSLQAHILVNSENMAKINKILTEINSILKSKYKITHISIQSECEKCTKYSI